MTTDEKAAAFDLLAAALTNRWWDGTFSIWGGAMWEQPHRATAAECIPDLIEWARRAKRDFRGAQRGGGQGKAPVG
jgi:hypothetical protein